MYRCNSCDIEAPIEELRLGIPKGAGGLYSLEYMAKAEEPEFYYDMLLCDSCKLAYETWRKHWALEQERSRIRYTVPLIPLETWSRAY